MMIKENYDSLPEKIPVSFGITGQAQIWVNKNSFTTYLIFFFNLAMWTAFLIANIFVSMKPDWFWAAFAILSTPQWWILNKGIINYFLGKAKNMWNYIAIIFVMSPFETVIACTPLFYNK
ncbi:hypothetical protein KKB18_12195 [bacterium]|nr:hypothetical protein [bacterium]